MENTIQSSFSNENEETSLSFLPEKVTKLPIYGLPMELQSIITQVSEGFDSPRDFSVVSSLAVLSTVVGKNVISNDGAHENFSSCWYCIVANSGVGKSDPQKFFTKPLIEGDKINFIKYKEDIRRYEALPKEEQVNEPKPLYRKFILDDSTPEKRNDYLSYNNGMLQNTDELKGFFDNTNRYAKSGEISQLLSISDNTTYACDRVSKEPMLVEHPFLNILGGIQPNILHKCFTENLIDNGFIFRFLFVYYQGQCNRIYGKKKFNSKELQNEWSTFLIGMQSYYQQNTELCFTDDALQIIYDFGNNVITPNKQNTTDNRIMSVYDKSMIWLERLSLITAIANKHKEIITNDVKYALECTQYFINNTLLVLNQIDSSIHKTVNLPKQELVGRFFDCFPELTCLQSTMNKAIGKSDSYFQAAYNKYCGKKERL